jgi:ubiquinone/menaquinone biosynthesis C-methylase UbiE
VADSSPVFTGSIPTNYQQYLVPFLFEEYAIDLAARLSVADDGAVLEMACGTGVVTAHLRASLPPSVRLIASDLNSGMLEVAKSVLDDVQGVEYEIADGTDLQFDDVAFDTIVCQFGVMLFPDKAKGFAESFRVLKPGGCLLFSVWDALENNPLSQLIHETIIALSPDDPATFLGRPHSYSDLNEIRDTLEAAGFRGIDIHVQPRESRAESAWHVVMGLVAGGPLAAEIEARGLTEKARDVVEAALRADYGDGQISAPMQAIIVKAGKPI